MTKLVKCDSENAEKFINSSCFCTAPGMKAPRREDSPEFCNGVVLGGKKYYMAMSKSFDDIFSRFHTTLECFRQTVWYPIRKSRDCTHQFHSACR